MTCRTVRASLYTGTTIEISSDDEASGHWKIGRSADCQNAFVIFDLSNLLPICNLRFHFCASRRRRVLHSHVADDRNRAARRRVVRRLAVGAHAPSASRRGCVTSASSAGSSQRDRLGADRRDGFDAARARAAADALEQIFGRAGTRSRQPRASAACCRASARRSPAMYDGKCPSSVVPLLQSTCGGCAG